MVGPSVRRIEGAPCFAFQAGVGDGEECDELSFFAFWRHGMWWYFCRRHAMAYTLRSLDQLLADLSAAGGAGKGGS